MSESNELKLFNAAKGGDLAEVKRIINENEGKIIIDWGNPGENGNTALIMASMIGNVPIIKLLIENGANVNRLGKSDNDNDNGQLIDTRPLHEAAKNGNAEAVEALLYGGADSKLTDGSFKTAKQLAETNGFNNIVETIDKYYKNPALSAMYIAQNGNPNLNLYNNMDPETWKDLNAYIGPNGGKKRRKPNKSRRNRSRRNRSRRNRSRRNRK